MTLGAALKSNNGPGHSPRLLKFQPVCALGPLAYFRWVIDDKLSLDILSRLGWSSKPKANILLPNAVHSCISLCTINSLDSFPLFLCRKMYLSNVNVVSGKPKMMLWSGKNLPRLGR